MQKLTVRYTPGDVEPSSATHSSRVILAWRKARDDYWNREQTKKMEQERYAKRQQRDPDTLEGFQNQEVSDRQRAQQRALSDAEELRLDRAFQQQQEEAESRRLSQAAQKDYAFKEYWEAVNIKSPDWVKWLTAYAQAAGLADGVSGGFASQEAADRTIASLRNINNCPANWIRRYKEIRVGIKDPALRAIDSPEDWLEDYEPSEVELAQARRIAAREKLLGF